VKSQNWPTSSLISRPSRFDQLLPLGEFSSFPTQSDSFQIPWRISAGIQLSPVWRLEKMSLGSGVEEIRLTASRRHSCSKITVACGLPLNDWGGAGWRRIGREASLLKIRILRPGGSTNPMPVARATGIRT